LIDRVTLDDLRVFQAVCEARNLSAVARALGRTQPAVGQHVARLERELGVALLERTRRGVVPTAAGGVLREAAAAGLGALDLAVREIARHREGEAGRLSVATGGTTVRHFLREAVTAFRRRHPAVALHFEPVSSTRQCLEAVALRGADLALVTLAGDLRGFEQRPLMEHPLVLLARSDAPLGRRRRVGVRELATIRHVALSEATTSHRVLTEALAAHGVALAPVARVDDFDTAHVFVELGLGEAIVPAVHGRSFARAGRVKAIPIHGLPPILVGWAARSFAFLPPVATAFMEAAAASAVRWRRIPGVRLFPPS
jgi:DNA-binding transcriptional LysR family regulator